MKAQVPTKEQPTKKTKAVVVREPQNNSPAAIIRAAVEKGGIDLDKLQKALELQIQWDANEARKAFNVAMSEFKANAPQIVKNKKVDFGAGKASFKYAALDQIAGKIAAEMSKHGLSASWRVVQNGTISVTTRVSHVQGHFEETTLSAPADVSGNKNPHQALGSSISYLQRYGLLCITGLAAAGMDDDGNSTVSVAFIDDKELGQLRDLMAEKNVPEAKVCEYLKVESLEKMPKSIYQKALVAVQNARVPVKK